MSWKPEETTSVVANTKHPEANSELIETVLKGISPNLRDIKWLESDHENLILNVDADPEEAVAPAHEDSPNRDWARKLQAEVMKRLHAGPSSQS